MKKIILIIACVYLLGGFIYTIYDYIKTEGKDWWFILKAFISLVCMALVIYFAFNTDKLYL